MPASWRQCGRAALRACGFDKTDLTPLVNSYLAGLAASTAGLLTPSRILGTLSVALGGSVVVLSFVGVDTLRIVDPVGALSVYGVARFFSHMLVPLTYGEASIGSNALTLLVWAFSLSLLAWLGFKRAVGVRVDSERVHEGMDTVECGIETYPEFIKTT